MDDTNQIPSQNQTNVQAQPQTQTLQGQTQAPTQQPQGGSVGSLVKEHGPTATGQTDVSEFVKPSGSEIEPEIHPELKEIGVRHVPEFPKVGREAQKIGISPAKESVPVLPQTSTAMQLLKQLEAQGASKKGTGFSVRWLLETLKKVVKQLS